jgi:hypothetical protein
METQGLNRHGSMDPFLAAIKGAISFIMQSLLHTLLIISARGAVVLSDLMMKNIH